MHDDKQNLQMIRIIIFIKISSYERVLMKIILS